MDEENYNNYFEWEKLSKPEEITNLILKNQLYEIPEDCIIRVWRNDDYKLEATLSGIATRIEGLENKDNSIESFLRKENIDGTSINRPYYYNLGGVIISKHTSHHLSVKDPSVKFEATLLIDSFTKFFTKNKEVEILKEWFICGKSSVTFPRTTKRKLSTTYNSSREEKKFNFSDTTQFHTSSRDYFEVNLSNCSIIISSVPENISPKWANKLCIEYRLEKGGIPEKETREAISELVSFALGTQMMIIGSSFFDKTGVPIKYEAINPWGNSIRERCTKQAHPPIRIDDFSSWGNIEEIVSGILPNFLLLRNEFRISEALSKYWIAVGSYVGVNLPIISSAVETLADAFLKQRKDVQYSYMEYKEFGTLIHDEIKSIAAKLDGFSFKEKILNKIKSASQRGANEKIDVFFDALELPIGKVERNAIKDRNKMAHTSQTKISEDEAFILVKTTYAYETLFKRIILKILGYEGNYIDYYSRTRMERNIDEAMSD